MLMYAIYSEFQFSKWSGFHAFIVDTFKIGWKLGLSSM